MKLPTTPTDFLRFSKLLLEKLPPGVRTRARSPASFPKSLKIAFSVISFSLQLPPPFSLPPLSVAQASERFVLKSGEASRRGRLSLSRDKENKSANGRSKSSRRRGGVRTSLSLSLSSFFLSFSCTWACKHTHGGFHCLVGITGAERIL